MASTLYKIRDRTTQKYWNGDFRRSVFNDTGASWKRIDSLENRVGRFLEHCNKYSPQTSHSLPDSWEIVEVELVEKEKGTQDLQAYLKYILLRNEVAKAHVKFAWFVDKMRDKGVLDKIEFLLLLKPAEDSYHVDRTRIVEARSHLRQLGVKTRTFREGNGVFGMLDRQQALRARLTLEVDQALDLTALREKLKL
jgi:hypothetical protein